MNPEADAPPPPAAHPPALPASQISLLAVFSLIFGLLGCTVIGAIAGIVCGVMALNRINRSGGHLTGKGVAIAGIVVSAVMLLIAPAPLLLPALAKAKAKAQVTASMNRLKQLGLAARMYSTDNKETFPAAKGWSESLRTYLGPEADKLLRRPASPSSECGYGYNEAVAGKKESEITPQTVLFFELDQPGRDVVGGEELLRQPRGNGDPVVVGFADGSVRALRGNQLNDLHWGP